MTAIVSEQSLGLVALHGNAQEMLLTGLAMGALTTERLVHSQTSTESDPFPPFTPEYAGIVSRYGRETALLKTRIRGC
jgi:hypothetical protein